MSCRGICSKHACYTPVKKIDYAKGMKVCMTCDRAVFVGLQGIRCPCCNKNLHTRPQYHGEKGRHARQAASLHLAQRGDAENRERVA